MPEVSEVTKGSLNPVRFFRTLSYKFNFALDNPLYFRPAGIWVFCGPQGSGKTLSAVQTVLELHRRYPAAMIVSNLDIKGLEYTPFVEYEQLLNLSNGTQGIIFLIDEIHVLWNSLESKDIPISEMATFAQMRKDRRVIIGTSQVYGRIAKPIREQLQYVVRCRNYFGVLQHNEILDPAEEIEKDGHLAGKLLASQWWFHAPELYQAYDTLNKINRMERKKALALKRSFRNG